MTKKLFMAIVEHADFGAPRVALFHMDKEPSHQLVKKRFAGLATRTEMKVTDLFDITGEIAEGTKNRTALVDAINGDTYTVTLYYPTHMCESGKTETYMDSCEAKSEEDAIAIIKQRMVDDNPAETPTFDEIKVCSVQRGECSDVK